MNDADIEQVLRSAGPREKPPVAVERAVHDSLRAEWRALVAAAHRRRRRRTGFALAAGVLAAAVGVWVAAPRMTGPTEVVATLALATGEVRVRSGWFGGWHSVTGGQALASGQTLQTGSAGRGVLTLPGGVSARMDHDTRVLLAGGDEVVLERGALYVDAGLAPAVPLDVVTPAGSLRHVGTQYEVRLLDPGVRLRVREGRVDWQAMDGAVEQSEAGEQLTIANDGSIERTATPLYGESWDWIANATPVIDIEGLPLAEFLAWAARELGREVVYATAGSESEAAGIVVHGSISGLTPLQALDAVLATTSVRARVVEGYIVVGVQDPGFQPSVNSSAAKPAT
ncbi:MAG: FecR domain-containing protein [Steroidobacteraceae bacterium]